MDRLRRGLASLRYLSLWQWPKFMMWKRGGGKGETAFRIKGIPKRMLCRAGTTDAVTIASVFDKGYHLPPKPLPEDAIILDLGANAGYAAAHFASLYPKAKVIAVELDEGNADLAQRNLAGFPNATLLHAGVWVSNGTVSYGGGEADAYSIGKGAKTAKTMTIASILDLYGAEAADYVKMDIEGAEWEMFKDPSWLDRINSIGIELHDRAWVSPIAEKLRAAGFETDFSSGHWSQVSAYRVGI